MSEKTKKNDFVEIKFSGYANGELFDSNVEEELKKLNPEAKETKTFAVVGQGTVVKGLDKALEDKELDKDYETTFSYKEGFGERNKNLIKTVSISSFKEKNFNPQVGMVLALDNNLAKIISVSGARVLVDFNNPLAGKELKYKFKIIRILTDEKEKAEVAFTLFLGFSPEIEVKDTIVIKGSKNLEPIVKLYSPKFKELLGKELSFEEKEEKKEDKKEKHEHTHEGHDHSHEHGHEGHKY